MKMKYKLEKLTPLVLGTCLLTLAACGSDDDDDGGGAPAPQQEERQAGNFRAILSPVNANVSGLISGNADITLEGDTFEVRTNLNSAPNAPHSQHIHIGTACPEPTADTNGDGFVDAREAEAATGKIIIPLDNDLRAQTAGGDFPSGATYSYSESTSFLAMLADLKLPDDDATDSMIKLGLSDELDLEGKVVEIHGVPSSVTLPATVQSIDGKDPHETLPIACGVITRVQTEETGTTTGDTSAAATTGTTTGETGTASATTTDDASTTGLSGI